MKHQFAQVNGINMHFVTEGEGFPLVLLHGFPQFWYTWRHQIPELAKHYKIIVPDLRGYGQTDRPINVADYHINILTADIVSLIKNLGYEKAHVVGHDWGGAIAWKMAIDHPEVVDKLVVINSPHPHIFAKAMRTNYRQLAKFWYMFFFQISYLPEFLFKIFGKSLIKSIFRGSAIRKKSFSDEDLEIYYNELNKPGAFSAALNYYRAAIRSMLMSKSSEKKIKAISAPTLLIWGENDSVLGKELSINMDKLFIGPFHVHYISDCSHWVQEEQPAVVNQLIINHLK